MPVHSPPTRRTPAPDLARLPIVFTPRNISLAEGLRAGLSTAVIIAASQWLHWPGLIEAALAALFTCLCDAGGPMRRRVPALLGFAVLGALIVGAGGLVRGFGLPAALPFGFLVIFCATFARIYGQSAQQVGTLLCVVLVLSLDHALPDLASAAAPAGMFLAGGVWATALTMLLWPLHPFLPARIAVGNVYQALALLTRDLQALVQAPVADSADWERHARAHRRTVREAIEAARGVVLDTVRSRGPASNRAAQSVIRLEIADQLFGALIGLSDLFESAGQGERAAAVPALRRLRPLLSVLGQTIRNRNTEASERTTRAIARAIDAIAADLASLPEGAATRRLGEAIVERLRIAHTLAVPANFTPGAGLGEQPHSHWLRIRRPLLANLNWQSLAFRHALRAAVATAPALAFTLLWFTPYDHWLTITIVATMQPYFGNTFTRALERVGGTVLGGGVAALLGLVVATPLAMAGAMFPLAVLAFAIRTVSFGLFMAALTPMVVLLVELGQPGASEWMIAGLRALLTLAGGLVAIAGCAVLWPSWEPNRLAGEIRAAIAAHGSYAAAEFSFLLGETDAAAVDQARRVAGRASNNVEASISRALLEPGGRLRDGLEAAMVIDAALRRLAGRLSAMQLDPTLGRNFAPQAWRDWIAGSLQALSVGTTAIASRPDLAAGPHAETLGRIARQIELMAGTLARK